MNEKDTLIMKTAVFADDPWSCKDANNTGEGISNRSRDRIGE